MFFGTITLNLSEDAETSALELLADAQRDPIVAEINPVPADWRTAWADIVITIDGLQYMVMAEALNPDTPQAYVDALETSLREFAKVGTEITITCGSFDQDVCAAQGRFPGGGINISEFYVGRLRLIDDYWCKPDGTRLESLVMID